jgi:hypothetical protein
MRKIDTTNTNKKVLGSFVFFKNETYYKIENYNAMTDFFMTITSSSDVWNFLWSKGGITAGRVDSNYAVFPYYTADKVSDMKYCTGSFTAIKIQKADDILIWTPFSDTIDWNIQRTIYKNTAGSKIWFEETNTDLNLVFRYGWTSSNHYGLVRNAEIENFSDTAQDICILDGCRNIMPACITSDLQNENSVLVDAYKKTDLDMKTGLVMLGMSSVLTDKAEPSEGLRANTCWFSKNTPVYLSEEAVLSFMTSKNLPTCQQADEINEINQTATLKGKRASSYITQNIKLSSNLSSSWYQVFDTALDISHVNILQKELSDRESLIKKLEADIKDGQVLLENYITLADGFQNTADKMSCVHHEANVMFNIMRGGIIVNNGLIDKNDFLNFIKVRNIAIYTKFVNTTQLFGTDTAIPYTVLAERVKKLQDAQMFRLYLEYLPLTFSRRHGDPSRPWNKFSIKTQNEDGSKILNYEGNWRDIFQNWEALSFSYPEFAYGMIAKFLSAMTVDGFNPYRISRNGVDWEVPDPGNPWSNIGFWNDHQVIYLCKLLELQYETNPTLLETSLDKPLFSSSNMPYRIKKFNQILENPRDTIDFDYKLNDEIEVAVLSKGTDAKLLCDQTGTPIIISMVAKLLQVLVAKMANFIPEGGIWMNTQRPEWNDANNALAGFGLSMVTVAYLRRYISFLIKLFDKSSQQEFSIPVEIAELFTHLSSLFTKTEPEETYSAKSRINFVKTCGLAFEKEREALYSKKCFTKVVPYQKQDILKGLNAFRKHIDNTIKQNKKEDGLYHSYNTLVIKNKANSSEYSMEIKHLDSMLEGQVAIISSGAITPEKTADLYEAMMNSDIREKRQYSYILYPNKKLPFFTQKNCIFRKEAEQISVLKEMLKVNNTEIITADITDTQVVHFNANFRNSDVLRKALKKINVTKNIEEICTLYEKTFDHQSFTGRSGTFYAYEGLGSIYWHMVSKLLLAIQENVFIAKGTTQQRLIKAYYDVRKGLGFNKSPELYGAFPSDPYSHTPENQGAKQPGMTGQVKEEVITRWGELGIFIHEGVITFNPLLLRKCEFSKEGNLDFTRFGCKFIYTLMPSSEKQQDATHQSVSISVNTGKFTQTNTLCQKDSHELFIRSGKISCVRVQIPETILL